MPDVGAVMGSRGTRVYSQYQGPHICEQSIVQPQSLGLPLRSPNQIIEHFVFTIKQPVVASFAFGAEAGCCVRQWRFVCRIEVEVTR